MIDIKEKYQFLRFIEFEDLKNWSLYFINDRTINYNESYQLEKIGNLLFRNKTAVKIADNISYKRATIKMNAKGILLRDCVVGNKIGTKNQFLIKSNQFLISKIDARNGAFGIVPEILNDGIITGNFWTFDVNIEKINLFYLTLLSGSKPFQDLCQSASVGTTNRNYLQEKLFLDFKIPLPPLATQQELVKIYQDKINDAENKEKQADELERSIDQYLIDELGVVKYENQENCDTKIHFIDSSQINRWGVNFLINSIRSKNILKSNKYNMFIMGNILNINPKTTFDYNEERELSFLPMNCISDKYGEVIKKEKGQSKLSKGYTRFKNNDIVWAKITPCMENGKSAIVKNLTNGFGYGSTEYHIIRNDKKPKEIDINYIYHLLRMNSIRKIATYYFTGSAGQQRVPADFLKLLEIPLPPLEIQEKISNHINDIKEKIKSLRLETETLRNNAKIDFENEVFSK